MLVSDLVNVRYLSGFTGSNAALLIRAEDETPVLATDGRYRTQAAQQAPDAEIVIERACGPHLVARAAADGVLASGLREPRGDRRRIRRCSPRRPASRPSWSGPPGPWRRCARSRMPVRSRCCGWPARPPTRRCTDLVERGGLRPGRTEKEVGRELESLMLDHGADGVSFETIVAAGPNSAIPHHRPTDAVLRRRGLREDRLRRAGRAATTPT